MADEHKPPKSDYDEWFNEWIKDEGNLKALVRFECVVTEAGNVPYRYMLVEQLPTQVEDGGADGSASRKQSP